MVDVSVDDDATVADIAHDFRTFVEIDDPDAQFKCIVKEVGELAEALNTDDTDAVYEEIGDVMVTVAVLADLFDVDAVAAYRDQMRRNMRKSASKKGAKVTKAKADGDHVNDPETRDAYRVARQFPGFDAAEPGTTAAILKDADGTPALTTFGAYGDAGVDDRIGRKFTHEHGAMVELLGDYNGHAVYRYLQADDGSTVDGTDRDGSIFKVTWPRWHDMYTVVDSIVDE